MLYLDTSALMKLIRREPASDSLADWLDAQTPAPWVSSTLIGVPPIVARVARYEIDEVVRAAAAAYPNTALGSLDAIHLATADAVFGTQLTAFVAYDERLLTVAAAAGLPTAAPGR
jgi:uncharacterized protein